MTTGQSRTSDPLGTVPSAKRTLRRHDSLLPELLQYSWLYRLPRAITLIALGATVSVASANNRVSWYRRGRYPPGQRAVTLVRRHARTRLGVVAAFATAHVSAAASVRGGTHVATQSSTCFHYYYVSINTNYTEICCFRYLLYYNIFFNVSVCYFGDWKRKLPKIYLINLDFNYNISSYMYRCLPKSCGTFRFCSSYVRIFSYRVYSPALDSDDYS